MSGEGNFIVVWQYIIVCLVMYMHNLLAQHCKIAASCNIRLHNHMKDKLQDLAQLCKKVAESLLCLSRLARICKILHMQDGKRTCKNFFMGCMHGLRYISDGEYYTWYPYVTAWFATTGPFQNWTNVYTDDRSIFKDSWSQSQVLLQMRVSDYPLQHASIILGCIFLLKIETYD